MNERIVELLMLIMSEMQENELLSDVDMIELKSRGFTQSEITAAFSWLYDHMGSGEGGVAMKAGKASQQSRRFLHEAEKMMLTTESQGYLVQAYELGLLDNRDLESAIERVMVSGYERVPVDVLREIVAAVLVAKGNGVWGGRMMNSRDTVH